MGTGGARVKVLQTVIVKQVLTEDSKRLLLEKYQRKKFQLEKEMEQLKFELKKQEKLKKLTPEMVKRHYDNDIKVRTEKIQVLDFHMEQLHMLPLGSELKESELQALVEIREGDSWEEFREERTILVKDGIVIEIRER